MKGEQYLTKSQQYSLVYNQGKSWADTLLVLRALPNSLSLSRYGLSVSKRVGGAVVRNRIKRLLREIMRLTPLKPGWDIVLIARRPSAVADYSTLSKSVRGLLSRARLIVEENENIGSGID